MSKYRDIYFELVVSKVNIDEGQMVELRRSYRPAFEMAKANINTRYKNKEFSENNNLTCCYCGKDNLQVDGFDTFCDDFDYFQENFSEFYFSHNAGFVKSELASVDHINPISRGGAISLDSNLSICCMTCNKKKDNMTLSEWVEYAKPQGDRYDYFFNVTINQEKFKNAIEFKPFSSDGVDLMYDKDIIDSFDVTIPHNKNEWYVYLKHELKKVKQSNLVDRIVGLLPKRNGYIPNFKTNINKGVWVNKDGNQMLVTSMKVKMLIALSDMMSNYYFCQYYDLVHKTNLSEERMGWKNLFDKRLKELTPNDLISENPRIVDGVYLWPNTNGVLTDVNDMTSQHICGMLKALGRGWTSVGKIRFKDKNDIPLWVNKFLMVMNERIINKEFNLESVDSEVFEKYFKKK